MVSAREDEVLSPADRKLEVSGCAYRFHGSDHRHVFRATQGDDGRLGTGVVSVPHNLELFLGLVTYLRR